MELQKLKYTCFKPIHSALTEIPHITSHNVLRTKKATEKSPELNPIKDRLNLNIKHLKHFLPTIKARLKPIKAFCTFRFIPPHHHKLT